MLEQIREYCVRVKYIVWHYPQEGAKNMSLINGIG